MARERAHQIGQRLRHARADRCQLNVQRANGLQQREVGKAVQAERQVAAARQVHVVEGRRHQLPHDHIQRHLRAVKAPAEQLAQRFYHFVRGHWRDFHALDQLRRVQHLQQRRNRQPGRQPALLHMGDEGRVTTDPQQLRAVASQNALAQQHQRDAGQSGKDIDRRLQRAGGQIY